MHFVTQERTSFAPNSYFFGPSIWVTEGPTSIIRWRPRHAFKSHQLCLGADWETIRRELTTYTRPETLQNKRRHRN